MQEQAAKRNVVRESHCAGEWVAVLGSLTRLLDAGRIYDRDLSVITGAMTETVGALNRRNT